MQRPLDLDAVEAFVRVAELESFTRAAEAMQTSQAAVSLKLKRLEDRLGCRLLERTPGMWNCQPREPPSWTMAAHCLPHMSVPWLHWVKHRSVWPSASVTTSPGLNCPH